MKPIDLDALVHVRGGVSESTGASLGQAPAPAQPTPWSLRKALPPMFPHPTPTNTGA